MAEINGTCPRGWTEVAAELSREEDPERLLKLVEELISLLEGRARKSDGHGTVAKW